MVNRTSIKRNVKVRKHLKEDRHLKEMFPNEVIIHDMHLPKETSLGAYNGFHRTKNMKAPKNMLFY